MAKQSAIEQDGSIIEALSNAMFRVDRKWTYRNCSYIWKNAYALYQIITW
jgi:translation initiation factor IF-1